MKKFISIIFLAFISLTSFAQGAFDKSIAEISSDLAGKLSQKSIKKVVVLYITDINKSTTVAGKYIADVISINIVNNTGNFQVFDRENLSGIAEAKKLISEGYIDVDKAKELGKLLSVEAIIIGNYTVLSNTINLTIKALDANTGFIIAGTMKNLLIDNDAGALLGINVSSPNDASRTNNSNRGFNTPLNSNEQINNPATVSKECETKKIGDFCFENSSGIKVIVWTFNDQEQAKYGNTIGSMELSPGQTQCFYNLKSKNYVYQIRDHSDKYRRLLGQGEFLVETCKSKTFRIK